MFQPNMNKFATKRCANSSCLQLQSDDHCAAVMFTLLTKQVMVHIVRGDNNMEQALFMFQIHDCAKAAFLTHNIGTVGEWSK